MAAKLGSKRKREASGAAPKPGEAAGATAGHNAAARADILRNAFKKLWMLDSEIAATIEREVAPLREERREVWKNLRNDLDAKSADLAPLYALYKRDQEVRELNDMLEQRKSQDALREAFETLGSGETLNFLTVVDGGGDRPAPDAQLDPDRRAELAEQGRTAYRAGGTRADCPWPPESEARAAWLEGFEAGQAATAAEMDPVTGTAEPDERRPGQPPRTRIVTNGAEARPDA